MRSLYEVIDQIIKEIPKKEEGFIISLKSRRESALYTAPEVMSLRWGEVSTILGIYLPKKLTEDWHFKVVSIFSTIPEEDLRQQSKGGK